ncbi:MAG: cyclically-permuted mutarotase family protein [Prevotella sp.]|nr:cyclically-permuted mutarotase family protein [Prevotella sp.]
MKTLKPLITLVLLAALAVSCGNKNERRPFNSLTTTALPQLSIGDSLQGVAAPMAGMVGNELIVAGGCNFPDVPAADGGEKKFYTDIYGLDALTAGSQWHKIGDLPQPLAYGASLSLAEGLICMGGTSDGKTSVPDVFLLSSKNGKAITRPLPSLPVGLDQFAATYDNGVIYVAGGQSNGTPNHKVYSLAIGKNAQEWETIEVEHTEGIAAEAAAIARLQPCIAIQTGANGAELFIMGGYDAETKTVNTTMLVYHLKTKTWRTATSCPTPGATAVACGANNILVFGGVDRQTFESALQNPQPDYLTHPAEWYKFRDSLLVYNTITDAWTTSYANPQLARAGAAVVKASDSNTYYIINGELKPGIRSADVTKAILTYDAHFGLANWLVLILYLVGMIMLGIYFMQRQKGGEDFFKGGGRIPWWAAGISIFATMLSAITYMSIPAKAYMTDWTYYPMQICILIVSFPVIKYYLPFFRRLNVTTAYEYLERRFNYATRFMASLLFIVFMIARTALVIFLPSLAMTAVTGINIYICIVLMAVITIVYCTMGGVEAVVWGDVIQGIILVGGAVLAAVYLITNTAGGAEGFWQIAHDNNKFQMFVWSLDWKSATFWVVILGGLANNLISYTSDQTVIQRYLTTKDEHSAARGILTNGLMSVVVTIAFFTIGTGLYTFFKTHPAAMDITMQKTDAIFPFFMMSQLPAGLAGLLIAAVFAATMSTIASNINSISTAFTVDFWERFHTTSESGQVKTARVAGMAAGLLGMFIAILMAMVDIQSLLDYFNTILGLLSGGIGGLFLMGIFFPRIGSRAALVGFVVGTATVVWMNFCTPASFLLFGFVSMAVSVVVALLLSLVWPERREQKGYTWQTLERLN